MATPARVKEPKHSKNELALNSIIFITCRPDHMGFKCNEKTDILAK